MDKKKLFLIFSIIFGIQIVFFLLIKDHTLMIDENYHYRQIMRFMGGDFRPDPLLSMLPGYHLVVMLLAKIFSLTATSDIRFISFVLNLTTIPLFYFTAKAAGSQQPVIKTFQFSFFPIIFPFFPLIYTDIFSLIFILGALLSIYKKYYLASGIIASLSILVRQNNIFWLLFFFLFIYVRAYGGNWTKKYFLKHLRSTYTYLFGPLLLAEFFLSFGALTVGDRQVMYLNLLNQSNIFLVFCLWALFFLPLLFSLRWAILQLVLRYKLFLLLLPPVFFVFQFIFTNTHPYNQAPFFLHNALSIYFTQNLISKFVFFLGLALSIFFLATVKFKEKAGYLIYPVTGAFLLPVWFMEWRYYVIPYVLFLLFRKSQGRIAEYSLLLYFMALSFYFYSGIFRFVFFL